MDPAPASTFVLSAKDFDASLLPPHARTPSTDAFREAVVAFFQKEYAGLGGRARVAVDEAAGTITVDWWPPPDGRSPLQTAVDRLEGGDYEGGIRLLEVLRHQDPANPAVLYNLGMALSDKGRLDRAVPILRSAVASAPRHVNARVGLGVALIRQGSLAEAAEALAEAVRGEPDNLWARRNLGACLMKLGRPAEAEPHLRRATEVGPSDQPSWLGLAQVLLALGRVPEADAAFIRTIRIDDRSDIAEFAKKERSKLAQTSFREKGGGSPRMDAVMYCLAALERFGKLPLPEVQQIAFEVAMLGHKGFDTNDPAKRYSLKSLPGQFSGLQMVCYMYVGFKKVAPDADVGFDLSEEYKAALEMYRPE